MTTWTATAERMPDDDQCVLIAMEDGEVWTGFHADDRWFFVSAEPVGSPVTHWAEFPEPPNAEVSGAGTASAGLTGWQANGKTE